MGLEVARFSDSNPKYVKGRRAQAGLLPSLDTTLPRNDGVYQYIDIRLREGAVVGIPKWPSSTSLATMGITDYVSNMVLNVWEQIVPGSLATMGITDYVSKVALVHSRTRRPRFRGGDGLHHLRD